VTRSSRRPGRTLFSGSPGRVGTPCGDGWRPSSGPLAGAGGAVPWWARRRHLHAGAGHRGPVSSSARR